MSNTWIERILIAILLVFLQVWLFNKIHLLGYATPLAYVYIIIKFPVDMNRNLVVALSALLGFVVDLFMFTLGMNMLATLIIGFTRSYILKLFAPRDIFGSYAPSNSTFGKSLFFRYACLMTLIHQIILFSVESLSFFELLQLILRIAGSFVLTMLLIFSFERIKTRKYRT